ncbi:MAG TPA: thioesterase, partial [Halomonas sp.]|nr:thioesterase [Halomonas sp.]
EKRAVPIEGELREALTAHLDTAPASA